HGRTWSAPLVVSDIQGESVQGSRPIVGEDHDVFVIYAATDVTDPNFPDHMRIRPVKGNGRRVGPFANIGEGPQDEGIGIIRNFGAGPPGFNRGNGVEFPSIAVNRSSGRGHGGLYACWNESGNFF